MQFPEFSRFNSVLSLSARLVGACLICTAAIFATDTTDVQQADGENARQLIKQSDKLLRRGNLPEAERVLRRALVLSPENSLAKLKLAFVNIKQRRLLDAYNLSFEVAQAEPDNAFAFAVLGTTILNAGKFPEARKIFYTALKVDKREALAWAGLGLIEFFENRIEDCVNDLRQAVYLDPEVADYYFTFAQISARAEKYSDAADAYNRFLLLSRDTDDERRDRIKGLVAFLRYLGQKEALYIPAGVDETSVNFELTDNRPVIQLKINEKDENLDFVLDTGSGISVISEETAKRLNVKAIARGGFAKGIGGDGKFAIVYGFLRQVQIGGVKLRNVPVYIRKFHSDGVKVDGYIGLSLISKFLTTIDYGKRNFSLAKREKDNALHGDSISLPLRLTSSGFLSGEVQIEGVDNALNFIVDTGASVSVISSDVAKLDSMIPYALAEKLRVVGSAGVTNDVSTYLLPRVSFGSHSRKSITAIALNLDMINEVSGFEQAGILGGNFLKNYRMTFDFKNSKVIFDPIERAR
jgi:predicted aspartyl protease/thioredoxin-like negative regulator of GroEL